MTDTPYLVLDLFSGIGGFSLGLERAGMHTVAFCEQDGYARRVLRKHWPDVWLYEDVRTLTRKRLKADGLDPNVICGGFPCQDISCAGKGKGIEGERSGLWSEMFRLIREIKPLWVVAENVPALRGRGADRVLADLEGAGYTAWPTVVGAVHVGASHRRERVWIVAHPQRVRGERDRWDGWTTPAVPEMRGVQWSGQSEPSRMALRIPARVDRLRCLGNAVVPLIPELIGRAIIEYSTVLVTPA